MFSFLNRLLKLGIGGQGLFCSQYCGLILESFLFPSDLETLKLFTTNGGKSCLNFCSHKLVWVENRAGSEFEPARLILNPANPALLSPRP